MLCEDDSDHYYDDSELETDSEIEKIQCIVCKLVFTGDSKYEQHRRITHHWGYDNFYILRFLYLFMDYASQTYSVTQCILLPLGKLSEKQRRARAALESSLKRGSFDRISN